MSANAVHSSPHRDQKPVLSANIVDLNGHKRNVERIRISKEGEESEWSTWSIAAVVVGFIATVALWIFAFGSMIRLGRDPSKAHLLPLILISRLKH